MPDSKISQLNQITNLNKRDLLVVIDVPSSNSASFVTKNSTLEFFLANLPANTHVTGDISASANISASNIIFSNNVTPANSSDPDFSSYKDGTIWSDGSYIYVFNDGIIKRIALVTF